MKEKNKRIIEICRNLQRTVLTMQDTPNMIDSDLRGNNIWSPTKPTKRALERKLKELMTKNNIKEL